MHRRNPHLTASALPRMLAALARYLPSLFGTMRPAPQRAPAPVAAPAPMPEDRGTLINSTKARMTLVHRNLRQIAPELLPPLAEYRAVQNRLLSAIADAPSGAEHARKHVLGGLEQIEAATGKLSVVLADTTKDYAFGSYADTLERLSGEAMDCLCGLRAVAKCDASPEVKTGEQAA